MSLLLPARIISSASFRLTMVYAVIFVIVTLAAIFGVGTGAKLYFKADLKDELIRELGELEQVNEARGTPALIDAIEGRLRFGAEGGLSYQLSSAAGAPLAGNLHLTDLAPGWFEFVPPDEEDGEFSLATAMALDGGLWLVVAADQEAIYDTQELMLTGTGWTLAISLPLALLCGAMMSALVLRRIEAISATTQQIRDGGLSQRAPLRGTGDEFDRLTTHINDMLDSIEALTRNIKEVSSGIAHDLRTPLTRVSNRLQALLAKEVSREELEQEIEASLDEIASLLATFNALLRIGEIEAGTRRAGFRKLDFSKLVGELAETYDVMAAENERRLCAKIVPGIQFFADRSLLIQMIANVLDNAIVHTPPGTEISMSLAWHGDQTCLVIADNGPGIPDDERQRVLTRFYRADGSRGSNGNGLGMSIVSSISNLHGIKLVVSDNAPGLRVAFLLPAARTS